MFCNFSKKIKSNPPKSPRFFLPLVTFAQSNQEKAQKFHPLAQPLRLRPPNTLHAPNPP